MTAPTSPALLLDDLIRLSHEFGTIDFVRGGGGNTSVKTADTLWVKPSGTTLADLTAERLVPMDRARLADLYAMTPPADPDAREAMVRDVMAAALRPGASGRPSVEAPLHDTFSRRFVVHTHPPLVNGLTCAVHGEAAARELFPEAMWVPYVDPGYTLCMEIRRRLAAVRATPAEPNIVLLQNHGVFIAADTPDEIRTLYRHLMSTLAAAYEQRGVRPVWSPPPPVPELRAESLRAELRAALGPDAAAILLRGRFEVAEGPLSPDHIVYARSFPMTGPLTAETAAEYRQRHGFPPRVVVAPDAVAGVGERPRIAELAIDLAEDGAFVLRLTAAFGGPRYLDDAARRFIEHWEVEAYRQSVAAR
ncbi:MAG: class II aldolase/adducin family protein [Kiritimatiellae bacterium]|nr:class II aldolase/adducin family protein [Kiritimatiellia bacterium]